MSNSKFRLQNGFTLIEVLIVVVIIGILAAVVFPGYREYVQRSYRAEGQAFLNEVAARQERYFAQNNTYITDDDELDQLNLKNGSESETGKYTLSLGTEDDDGGYTLTADPQFDDDDCGNLTLTATGERGVSSGSLSDCWE